MVTNLDSKITFPFRCISYYASDKSPLDGKQSYEFWCRGKLTRIICNKPFSRGDVLEIKSIQDNSNGIFIDTTLVDEWEEEYPVLNFISGRLVYNKWADFEYECSDGIVVLKTIEQVLSDNYSIGFIVLTYQSGKILCKDKVSKNEFEVFINLSWE